MTSAEREVRDVVERIHELWQAKRYDEIGALLADDVVIAPPGAADRVRGRDAYVQSYRDYDAAAKTLAFERAEAEIDVVGDTAVAICRFAVTSSRAARATSAATTCSSSRGSRKAGGSPGARWRRNRPTGRDAAE